MYWYCPFKLIFGIPCPGCGTTRALRLLLNGQIRTAFYTNPLGLLMVFLIILSFGFWLIDRYKGTTLLKTIIEQPLLNFQKNHRVLFFVFLGGCLCIATANAYWNYKKGL